MEDQVIKYAGFTDLNENAPWEVLNYVAQTILSDAPKLAKKISARIGGVRPGYITMHHLQDFDEFLSKVLDQEPWFDFKYFNENATSSQEDVFVEFLVDTAPELCGIVKNVYLNSPQGNTIH